MKKRPGKRQVMEEALKGAQERLSAIIANAPIALFAVDPEGRITLSEGKALAGLGFKPGETVGRSVLQMYRDRPDIMSNLRRALAGESFTAVNEVSGVVLETRFAPHLNGKNQPAGFIGVSTDITERRLAERLLHQQSAAMKASMDGMAVLDEKGAFIFLNDALAKILGYDDAQDLIGKSWRSLYAAEELERFERDILPALSRAGQWHGETVGRRQDSSAFPEEISLTRIEGGGLVCVVRDISQRRLAEQEHRRLFALEKEAREQAEATSRAKDEFLAVVSHELRTPMTAILGWTFLLRSDEVSDIEHKRALEVIERNMKLQAQIIEDLLDVSSIVTGKLHLDTRPVDLAAVIGAALDTVRSSAEAKGVRLETVIETSTPVQGDQYRLQQVFWNLLSNAIKFNRPGGFVRVSLREEGGCAVAVVSDDGAGIPADFLPEVFDPFRQGESSLTRKHRGLGIGLAIVKHLVEHHGGGVQAASAGPGRGAVFTVTLPQAQAQAQVPAPPRKAEGTALSNLAHALDNLRVLLVDDEPDALEMLRELLEHCGAEVAAARSAPQALERLREQRPDLLVCDIAMPGEDGYSLIRKLRALGPEEGGDIAAMALTARASESDLKRALEAGFQMHVAKPVDPARLVASLRRLAGL